MTKNILKYSEGLKHKKIFAILLKHLNIDEKYLGYYYVIDILDILINQEVEAKSFCNNIYPVICKNYNKNACTVERDIRHMIDKTWNETLQVQLSKFWPNDYKPSCLKFIFILKDYVLSKIA